MTIVLPKLTISCKTDSLSSDSHTFCQIDMQIGANEIGDRDAWSVVGLMIGAISDMEFMLSQQLLLNMDISMFLQRLSSQALFEALHSWQWTTGEWAYESDCSLSKYDAKLFNALPLGTEIFDGESAYLILTPGESSRFIWRDYASKSIQEQPVDFKQYLSQWNSTKR